ITNDNITLIIPNSEFISSIVTNWSHNDRMVGLKFPVGVSYKEDPEHVSKVILEVVSKVPGVHSDPKPECFFSEYAESSLNFTVRVWTTEYCSRPSALKSMFYFDLFKRFKKEGIEIPYPQRDLHLKTSSVTF
ncbi:MAG: mechanosensitive ion channel, partial [Cyclobacteriaceae bacterium]|nr:mechanosensitive ion channel [Cyclobacteriaceae bacterium]